MQDDLVRVLEEHVVHLREQEQRRARFRAEMDSNNGSAPAPGQPGKQKKAVTIDHDQAGDELAARPDPSLHLHHHLEDQANEVVDLETALARMKFAVPLLAALTNKPGEKRMLRNIYYDKKAINIKSRTGNM